MQIHHRQRITPRRAIVKASQRLTTTHAHTQDSRAGRTAASHGDSPQHRRARTRRRRRHCRYRHKEGQGWWEGRCRHGGGRCVSGLQTHWRAVASRVAVRVPARMALMWPVSPSTCRRPCALECCLALTAAVGPTTCARGHTGTATSPSPTRPATSSCTRTLLPACERAVRRGSVHYLCMYVCCREMNVAVVASGPKNRTAHLSTLPRKLHRHVDAAASSGCAVFVAVS